MKIIAALMLAAGLLASGTASAQKLDLNAMKCGDFIKEGSELHGQVLMWLSGNNADEDDGAVIDFGDIIETGKKLGAFCAQNPGVSVMTAYTSATK